MVNKTKDADENRWSRWWEKLSCKKMLNLVAVTGREEFFQKKDASASLQGIQSGLIMVTDGEQT
jgi:hypothetical protein